MLLNDGSLLKKQAWSREIDNILNQEKEKNIAI